MDFRGVLSSGNPPGGTLFWEFQIPYYVCSYHNFSIMTSVEDTFSARLKELLNSTNTSTEEAIDCLSEMCENVLYYSYMLCI